MIVSKSIRLRWNNRIVRYYKEKGYKFTHEHDFFDVDIEDLMPTSNYKVIVRCDECGCERNEQYFTAFPRIETGNLCSPCATRKSNPVGVATKIGKQGSFLDAAKKQLGDDFLDKYWSNKNTIDPNKVCAGSKKLVWIKCQIVDYHDDYQISCQRFLKGSRCSQCYNSSVHPLDSLGQMMDEVLGTEFALSRWSKKNKITPFEVKPNSNKSFWFTCPDGLHEDYMQIAMCATIAEYRCPKCTREHIKSRLQGKVEDYIQTKYGYEMLFESECNLHPKNPVTGQFFKYDIEIPSLSLIIEVNGEQHYKRTSEFNRFRSLKSIKTPEEELEYQKFKDDIKRVYALEKGYSFLEIPYTSERGRGYKQLIDSAILSAQKAVSA